MIKKHGLGKGLGALIPDTNEKEKLDNFDNKVLNISINSIKPNKKQPRKIFDSDKIMQLSESIKQYGVIQPVVLKKDGTCYIIIAGERRWRAAKSIGLKQIPAIVMDMSEKEVLEVSLIENIQREDLNPIEEAEAYNKLIKDFNLTQEQLSKRIGKSRTSITNCMRLLNLDERVQQYIIEGVITEGHGRALLAISDKEMQYSLAQSIIDEKLSVREIEKLIKQMSKKVKKQEVAYAENPYYEDIRNRLEGYLGTKVFIKNKGKNKKGKIEIEYYSEDDFQRIIDMFNM
ncbi:ParB/RepB/Spo0J family partition protein [Haloimpatiens sp. FM7330]|uniref:ParB/RepB/Spo0J family partition protein n=1 Tax=Haloimpatiens sp. FM7330 TaxID=3298610 RepID=UPI00362533D7